jgi:streptogramin lyase
MRAGTEDSLLDFAIRNLSMETTTMFSLFTPLALIHASQCRRAVPDGRRARSNHRLHSRTRTRAQFQLEGLEERCLLSGISGITEIPVPGIGDGTTSITPGPDGNLWFTETAPNAIGMINPTTHAVSSFAVPTANAEPDGITAGPDRNIWFTELTGHKIGMINPTTDAISEFSLPTTNARPNAITVGPDGNIWFTESTVGPQQIGEINPSTHAISEFPLSNAPGSGPYGITAGPDGNLWFSFGADDVGRINPTTHVISYFSTPLGGYGITAGPDGNIWYAVGFGNYRIGNINPITYATSGFSVSGAPYGVTAGRDGNVWFSDQDGRIGRIDPTTDAITEYTIPYTNSTPYGITTGPDGNLWFTDGGTNAIGVATLATSQLVVTVQPPSSVTAGSAFGLTVEAEDSSGNLLSSFNGTVTVALATNPGGATLGGTLSVTASGGVAMFSGLSLTTAASGYTLVVSGSGLGEGVTSAITVTPAAASQLVITEQPPASVTVNSAFGLQASIEDAYGNVVTSDTNTVSVALANNPTGAKLGGTLSVSASQGVATFSGLTINKVGSGFTLQVASSGLTGAITSAISVVSKSKAIVGISLPTAAGTSAPNLYLAPLVFDSPDFLDSLGLKKRIRSI